MNQYDFDEPSEDQLKFHRFFRVLLFFLFVFGVVFAVFCFI